jgi:trigger factor
MNNGSDINYKEMKVSAKVDKKESAVVKITVTISKEDVNSEFKKAILEINKKAKVPGFRQGKVPETVIKSKFLPNIKYTVINQIIPPALQKALEDNDIKAFSQPEFDDVEDINENEEFTFKAVLETQATVELGNYGELEVKKNTYSYDKKQTDKYLDDLVKSHGTIKPKDGAIEEGDVCLAEYSFKTEGDDEPFKRSAMVEVTKDDQIFADDYKAFIGLSRDEEKTVETKVPENFPFKDIAGKKAELWIKIINISKREVPALDDEFAKDLGFENLEQLTLDAQTRLDKICRAKERDELTDEILDKIIETSKFDLPPSLIESQANQLIMNLGMFLRQSGIGFEQYLEKEGKTRDEFIKEEREKAEKVIKKHLILDEIGKNEKVEINDEDINKYLTEYSDDSEASFTKLKSDYENAEVKEAVDSQVKANKVVDFLIEKSKVGKGEKKKLEI